MHDKIASVAVPLKQLKGFERISLLPGEHKKVTFSLDKSHLALWNERMEWVVEPGIFRVMIGSSSDDIRLEGVFRIE